MTHAALFAQAEGEGPALLFLHGLGCTGDVWHAMAPLVRREWPGRIVLPDLRGHGRSDAAVPYGFGTMAADVAALFEQGEEVTIVAHSMGAAVAYLLATGLFGITVRRLVCFSMKIDWDQAEIDRIRGLAAKAPRVFETRQEAVARYLLVSGMAGHVPDDSAAANSGVVACDGGFCLAMDPRANIVAGETVVPLVASLNVPRLVLGGENDPLIPVAEMAAVSDAPVVLPGCGHNPHVEAPDILWRAMADFVLDRASRQDAI